MLCVVNSPSPVIGNFEGNKTKREKSCPLVIFNPALFFVSYAVTKLVPHLPNKGHTHNRVWFHPASMFAVVELLSGI